MNTVIQEVLIEKVKPYFKNAKDHPKNQIKKIAASIKEFGFNQPIVADKEGIIIVGHGRYLAALSLGIEEVPVIYVDLDAERATAYRLADNKLNESDWDMEIVIEELKTLSLQMVDLTGFNSDLILETKEDSPDISNIGKARSEVGDIYQLGRHKLICGDSCEEETYKKLLENEKVRLVFTDPPYSVDYQSPAGLNYASTKFGGTGGRIFNDDKTPQEALEFYIKALKNIYNYSTDDSTLYWWYALKLHAINEQAWIQSGYHFSQSVMWLKNSPIYSLGQLYHRIYEPCMVGWKEGKTHYFNRELSNLNELWTLDKKTFQDYIDGWLRKRDNTQKYIQPNQKPVQLA